MTKPEAACSIRYLDFVLPSSVGASTFVIDYPPRATRPDPRRGASAVELVLVLPVLIVIVIGGTDLGRAMQYGNVLSNSARVGAAYGATHYFSDYTYADWESRVEGCVLEEADHLPDFTPGQLDVVIDPTVQADGSYRVDVEVSYPFETIIHWPGWPPQIDLQRHVSMRGYR